MFEHSKKFAMTRKVDKTEYEDLGTCIRSDQVNVLKKLQKSLQIKHFTSGIKRLTGQINNTCS